MRTRLTRLLITACLAVAAAMCSPAQADAQEHANLVWKQLDAVFTKLSDTGFGSQNYLIGRMREDATDSWILTFERGKTYQIVGVCDKDCSDLDIEILDGDTVLEKDLLDDDHPVVGFTAKATSALKVRVSMAGCSDEPCYFGFGVFVK